jgi:nicotinamide mononucleotide (NMN) deamidase PncC
MGIVIKSNVRKESELSVSEEFLEEFEKKAGEMLKGAEERAKGNFRRTLFARDL